MKKIFIAVILAATVLISCGKSEINNENTVIVSENFKNETENYKKFVEDEIKLLLENTEKFAQVLKSGNIEEAKRLYPLIRMSYERSEPIAESFGESDINIDFRLVDFKEEFDKEEGWRGFHKIEQILWVENTTKGTEEYADLLILDIKELLAKISTVEVTPELMITGAIDLLNEISTSKITGEEEVYSHTDLYDFKANVEGAEKIYELFREKLLGVDSELVKILDSEFKNVNNLLDKYKIDDKNYKLYTELTKEDIVNLSSAVNRLGEPLSELGRVLEFNK